MDLSRASEALRAHKTEVAAGLGVAAALGAAALLYRRSANAAMLGAGDGLVSHWR